MLFCQRDVEVDECVVGNVFFAALAAPRFAQQVFFFVTAGKVIAVGPGTSEIKMEVKVGDQVLYGKYAGQEINVDGTDYLIMKQQDILAII